MWIKTVREGKVGGTRVGVDDQDKEEQRRKTGWRKVDERNQPTIQKWGKWISGASQQGGQKIDGKKGERGKTTLRIKVEGGE